MKLKKVREEYHLIKGMGNVVIGEISITFNSNKPYCRFKSDKLLSQEDLENINKFMKNLATLQELEKNES